MLTKVISGGQNGVDLAGVAAAKVCGIPTGGTMPKGWKTLDGPRPKYGPYFGMVEHSDPSYPPRTRANVKDADATLRFAYDFDSPGEICTRKAIQALGRPHLDINPRLHLAGDTYLQALDMIVRWLSDNNVSVLNVAGNSRKTHPKIGGFTYRMLTAAFDRLGYPIQDQELHVYCLENV